MPLPPPVPAGMDEALPPLAVIAPVVTVTVCGAPFAHLHHILEDRTPGRKSSDFLVVPLCYECHQGTHGIHGTRDRWKNRKCSETQALAATIKGVCYG